MLQSDPRPALELGVTLRKPSPSVGDLATKDRGLDPGPIRDRGQRQAGVGSREGGQRLVVAILLHSGFGVLAQPLGALYQAPGLRARRLRPTLAQADLLTQAFAQEARNIAGGLVLDRDQIARRLPDAAPLELRTGISIPKAVGHTKIVTLQLDGPVDQGAGLENLSDAIPGQIGRPERSHAVA